MMNKRFLLGTIQKRRKIRYKIYKKKPKELDEKPLATIFSPEEIKEIKKKKEERIKKEQGREQKKLKEKFLKWIEENPEKTKELPLYKIFIAVIGRDPAGEETKQIRKILDEKGIEYKKEKWYTGGLIDKVIKWIEIPENRKRAEEMTIREICRKVAGRNPKTPEKTCLEKLFLKKGIDYKKRFSLKEEIDKKRIDFYTKKISIKEALEVLEERRKEKEAVQSPLKKDENELPNLTQTIKTRKLEEPTGQKSEIRKREKAIKLTERIQKRSERDDAIYTNEEIMTCCKTKKPVDYWEVCRACFSRGNEEKDEQGKILSIMCEIEVPVK